MSLETIAIKAAIEMCSTAAGCMFALGALNNDRNKMIFGYAIAIAVVYIRGGR